MKEAFGGIFNLIFLIVFLVIVIGVLGLTFSYTKAFKMKSAVVSAIEEYEGNICHAGFKKKVLNEAKALGYSQTDLQCPDGYIPMEDLFCYSVECKDEDVIAGSVGGTCGVHQVTIRGITYDYAVFHVVTQFDIHFPIIEKIMNMHFFQVRGDTEEMYIRKWEFQDCS